MELMHSPVWTYNGTDRFDKKTTYGGYSERILVNESYVVKIPDSLDPAAAAPILCAGITTYSPLRHVGVKPGAVEQEIIWPVSDRQRLISMHKSS